MNCFGSILYTKKKLNTSIIRCRPMKAKRIEGSVVCERVCVCARVCVGTCVSVWVGARAFVCEGACI